ncbi:MAG: hypothetical protein R3C05_16525 [Pirellulaceae bacterium]
MRQSRLADPETTRRAKDLLRKGYAKLTQYECDELGYEWFGSDPGHEALTAFGLMQFTDMQQVMAVDDAMLNRTRVWLMNRRDGNGGFQRNPRHLHVWSVDQTIVDAYILWAISEADVSADHVAQGAEQLRNELNQLATIAEATDDPYLIALSAATLLNYGEQPLAEQLLQQLTSLQDESGMLEGRTTVVQSAGISRKVETTALAVLAWSKSKNYVKYSTRAIGWLTRNRQGGGGFGSTQATVLALKAMIAHAKSAESQTGTRGQVRVLLGDETIGDVMLPAQLRGAQTFTIDRLEAKLPPGTHRLALQAEGIAKLPYQIEVTFNRLTPPSDGGCPLDLTTQWQGEAVKDGRVAAGSAVLLKTVVTNTSDEGLPMSVAVIGLPAGLEPRPKQLNELRDAGTIDYYELRPREVVCYWRAIQPREVKSFTIDLTAEIPGKYTGPASRAYRYYTAESKSWTKPLEIEITKD